MLCSRAFNHLGFLAEVNGRKIGCDKHKVRSVLEVMLQSKAEAFLEKGDMLRYRYWKCAQRTSRRALALTVTFEVSLCRSLVKFGC